MEQKTQSLITSLRTSNYQAAIESLQTEIDKVVSQSVPVKQLINSGANQVDIIATIGMLITKFANMLTVGGNLKAGHEIEIAKMLVEEYPTLGLDDFNLILSRGVRGRYGEIFRFDVAVIFGWASQYMEEWAEEKERQLSKQKSELLKQPEEAQTDLPEVDNLLNDWKESLRDSKVKSVPQLTKLEIKAEGQSEPPKPKGVYYPSTKPEYVSLFRRKIAWAQLHTDLQTGKLKEGSPTFDEWQAKQV